MIPIDLIIEIIEYFKFNIIKELVNNTILKNEIINIYESNVI